MSDITIIVQKFGGTAMSDLDSIRHTATIVASEVENGNKVIVAVSAMYGETDRLLGLCRALSGSLGQDILAEHDVTLSAGEQIAAGLLTIAVQNLGIMARSWLPFQFGLQTSSDHSNARIEKILNINNILSSLHDRYDVAIVAGFYGIIESNNRITTLGRGGTDASAVALATVTNAKRCNLYKDVDGIYTADPKTYKNAKKITSLTHEEMLELTSSGFRIIQTRAVEIAMKNNIDIFVRSFIDPTNEGTLISSRAKSDKSVTGIAYTTNESMITLSGPKVNTLSYPIIFGNLARNHILIDTMCHNDNNLSFTIQSFSVDVVSEILTDLTKESEDIRISIINDLSKIAIVGFGMQSTSGIANQSFSTLQKHGIKILSISTSAIKISIIIMNKDTELAISVLHDIFI